MQPLRTMFEDIEFHPAEVPIYSCTTGELFPKEPAEIAELTVAHWESPVQFINLVENQYRDGVRCFIEAGPRNNLCSFAEDVLRGKDALIIPANVQRTSGITQINHLTAQLFVHHFEVDPSFLYQVRSGEATEKVESYATESFNELFIPQGPPSPDTGTLSEREQVMLNHLQIMEEFLATQQEVMQNYINRESASQTVELPDIEIREAVPDFPMVDEIIELVPGSRITARRAMRLEEDFFSAQHTVGGRELSQVDPEQYGLPVVPMTFSIEMLAEVSRSLFPGLQVTAMRDIKLYKWLDYKEVGEATAQVSATVDFESTNNAQVVINAELFHSQGTEISNPDRPAATATVEMATQFPEAPAAPHFEVINERTCGVTREVLYKNLFHGEEFQGVNEFGPFGDDGIEASVQVLPRTKLFTNNPDPEFVFDPVLMDVALHPMCAWHLEQEDQSGRILLPVGLDRIEFYGSRPDVGTTFSSRSKMRKETTRQFSQDVDLVDQDGRIWCHMEGSHYWRFYLPFRKFNFHGPKNIYMLSEDWPALPEQKGCNTKLLKVPNDLRNPTMQPIGARVTLSDREFSEFCRLDLSAERQTQWLFGRVAAKEAIRTCWFEKTGEQLFTSDIEIDHDEFGRPTASMRARETPDNFPAVSLSHSGTKIAAIASTSETIGIDIEKITPRDAGFLKIAFTQDEIDMLQEIDPDMKEWVARFWCAKEAVGKALGRGLINGPRSVEIVSADVSSGVVHLKLSKSMLAEFPQYKDKSITAQTSVDKKLAAASTICETSPLSQFEKASTI